MEWILPIAVVISAFAVGWLLSPIIFAAYENWLASRKAEKKMKEYIKRNSK